jgi:hypothetical protein
MAEAASRLETCPRLHCPSALQFRQLVVRALLRRDATGWCFSSWYASLWVLYPTFQIHDRPCVTKPSSWPYLLHQIPIPYLCVRRKVKGACLCVDVTCISFRQLLRLPGVCAWQVYPGRQIPSSCHYKAVSDQEGGETCTRLTATLTVVARTRGQYQLYAKPLLDRIFLFAWNCREAHSCPGKLSNR